MPPAGPAVRRNEGTVAAVAAVTLWGLGPVLVKGVDVPGMTIALHRLWMGAVVTAAAHLLRGGRISRAGLRASLPGGLAFGINIAFFFSAVKLTTVADATMISALQPAALLAVAGPLFGERVAPSALAWTALALGGVGLVVYGSGGHGGSSVTGDALAVGALLTWIAYFVASKQVRTRLGALEYQLWILVVATAVALPVAALSGQPLQLHRGGDWVAALAVALIPGSGHLLMNWAHAHIDLTVASLLTLATPVVAVIAAVIALGEGVDIVQLAGMALALSALAVVVFRPAARPIPDAGVEPSLAS